MLTANRIQTAYLYIHRSQQSIDYFISAVFATDVAEIRYCTVPEVCLSKPVFHSAKLYKIFDRLSGCNGERIHDAERVIMSITAAQLFGMHMRYADNLCARVRNNYN